jgi:regulator of sigma E protease
VNLAILNLLPIPVLDGGHLLFFTLEALLGRPIALKKIEIAQKVGMFLLLVLMLVVFYNDIMRLLPGHKPSFMP